MISTNYTFFSVFILIGFFVGCNNSPATNNQTSENQDTSEVTGTEKPITWAHPSELMTLKDAEIILGGKAAVMDTMTYFENDVYSYKSMHTAHEVDTSGRLSNLYFMYELYPTDSLARRIYKAIMGSYMFKDGYGSVAGIGDEAYYSTDGEKSYFFMVRKADKMIRMKINVMTEKSSLYDFKTTAKRIIDSI